MINNTQNIKNKIDFNEKYILGYIDFGNTMVLTLIYHMFSIR